MFDSLIKVATVLILLNINILLQEVLITNHHFLDVVSQLRGFHLFSSKNGSSVVEGHHRNNKISGVTNACELRLCTTISMTLLGIRSRLILRSS